MPGPSSHDAQIAASTSRFARWYASTRYDWFMLGVLVGIVWASLFWWVFR